MDDAPLVRGLETFGDLHRNPQGLVGGNWSLLDSIGERRPFDELHHERAGSVRPLQTIDRCDVRMIERGENLRFPLKPG